MKDRLVNESLSTTLFSLGIDRASWLEPKISCMHLQQGLRAWVVHSAYNTT